MDARQTRGDGRKARPVAWAALALVLSALPVAAQAAERVALVVGNHDYAHVPDLVNPKKDAADVGAALDRLGFAVTFLENAGKQKLERGLQEFEVKAARSKIAVVFYAGHGIEVNKANYLVPVDARLKTDPAVKYEAIPLSGLDRASVMAAVQPASELGLVILDACRDNPFLANRQNPERSVIKARGLARVEPQRASMLVAYSAREGTTAADGPGGGNSPYAEALLNHLETPGLEVFDMFRAVNEAVKMSTGQSQEPVTYGSVPLETFYLAGKGPSDPVEGPEDKTPLVTLPPPSGDAARAYEAAERLNTVAAYRIVVEDFPGTTYARLAQAWIDEHEGKLPPDPEAVEQGLKLDAKARRLVQMGLAAAGHSPGKVDGRLGPRTRKALRAWQASKGRDVTGYLTKEQSEGLAGLGREEAQRLRAEAERERKAREAEERRKRARKPGDTFRDCPECPEMVVVPAGRFEMGSPESEANRDDDEGPVHPVTIGYRLAVGVYEVTFGEWDACVSDRGCGGWKLDDEGWGRGRLPVTNASWHEAQEYVAWLSGKTGYEYRLLSEAEWEYVARAGTRTKYWWGDDIGRNRANCDGCGSRWDGKQTAPVGSFPANPFGLHDVHGNVWEWVEDCWNDSYNGAPSDGSALTSEDCYQRGLRGGSWDLPPDSLRSALRDRMAGFMGHSSGFRVARMLTPSREGAEHMEREAEERRRAAAERERKAREPEDQRRAEAKEKRRREEEENSRLARKYPAGTTLRDCPECPEMVVVPGGPFWLQFWLQFAVGVYEVTFEEWDACVSGGGCEGYRPDDEGWGRGRRPVVNVSWKDAQAYVQWLSRRTGEGYRLLSKAEWEYVAQAGTTTAYWWGNDIGRSRANCDGCGSRWDNHQTAPVGSFSANPFGLYDVHGNVWEWVEDCWEGDCGRRVLKGGSWDNWPSSLFSYRGTITPGGPDNNVGFRVARTLTP